MSCSVPCRSPQNFPVAFFESPPVPDAIPQKTKSAWISSLTTITPYFSTDVAQPAGSSSLVHTRPHRIVRVCREKKSFTLQLRIFFFKIRKIDPVSSVLSLHERYYPQPSCRLSRITCEKRIVRTGCCSSTASPRLRETPAPPAPAQKNNPRRLDQPGFPSTFHP